MAWAATSGAINYRDFDRRDQVCMLRERVTLDMVRRQLVAPAIRDRAVLHAILSRGTSWLTPESSEAVAERHETEADAAITALAGIIEPYYDHKTAAASPVEDTMYKAYVERFGGPPGSPEAEAEVARQAALVLPKAKASDGAGEDIDAAAQRGRKQWDDAMRPRSVRRAL